MEPKPVWRVRPVWRPAPSVLMVAAIVASAIAVIVIVVRQ